MSKLTSRAARIAFLATGTVFFVSNLNAQEVPLEPLDQQTDINASDGRKLQLEVFINDVSMKMIGTFKELPNGDLAATPDELTEVGIKPSSVAPGDGGLVRVDKLAGVSYRVDEGAQRIYITTTDDGRAARIVDVSPKPKQEPPQPRSGYGGVFNYSLFASSNKLFEDNVDILQGIAGAFDARLFSPFGTVNQSFIAGYSNGEINGVTRLNTTWSYSDPTRLMTYRAGDFISGGLSWTRPVYLAGIQAQRNFALRSDLVTLPLPSFEGTAAVPSTLEVYTQNVRTYSNDVPAGPFQVTNLPVFSGSGEARVVLRDSLGRETTATLPFYSSNLLLRKGLLDFSAEVGLPRRNFGIESSDYDEHLMGVATARYGVTDWLTLEGHFEGGGSLLNGGVGTAFPLGSYGASALAVAGSHNGERTGTLIAASIELSHDDWTVYGRMQRALGDYDDIASVTAEPAFTNPDQFSIYSAAVPRSLNQLTLSIPMQLDFSSLNLSYTSLKSANGENSKIVGLSYSQTIFKRSTFYASAFTDIGDSRSFGVFAGLSIPLGENITASTSIEQGVDGMNVVADVAKPEQQENGSVGWRARTSEGKVANRSASLSYRAPFARFETGVQQYHGDVRATAQMEGAIAVAGGSIFATNRIDDAFAVVDVGTSGVEVQQQNRPVGKTNRSGRILVPNLNSYEPNTISIDPKNLPVDADVPATKEVIVPADRSGVVVKFGVSETPHAALVTIVNKTGTPLQAGLQGKVEGGIENFVIGYDGQAYIRGLGARNVIAVGTSDGKTCRAEFLYKPQPGKQVVINGLKCL